MILEDLQGLLQYSSNGLFALINDSDKKVDIRYGINLLRSITSLVEQIKSNSVVPLDIKNDINKIRLKILEVNVDPRSLKLRHKFYQDQYKTSGYSLYRNLPANKYEVQVVLDKVLELDMWNFYLVLKLVSKSSTVVVGIFESYEELQDFVQTNYKDNNVLEVVYSTNECTSKYRDLLQST
jgi:hypothetical protein